MTLVQLLAAMKDNVNVNISLVEYNDSVMITFNAAGYESIESDLLSRTVDTITVKNSGLIAVKLTQVIE